MLLVYVNIHGFSASEHLGLTQLFVLFLHFEHLPTNYPVPDPDP